MIDDFVAAASLGELGDSALFLFDVDGEPRLLVHSAGEDIRAFDGMCTHEDADLIDGDLEDGTLWCPFHASGFDMRTGRATCPPATEPLKQYQVQIEDDTVYVSRTPLPGA